MRYGPETLRRRVYEVTGLSEVFNDPNISINLKSSPEKTVANLSTIAVKEGQVRLKTSLIHPLAYRINDILVKGTLPFGSSQARLILDFRATGFFELVDIWR